MSKLKVMSINSIVQKVSTTEGKGYGYLGRINDQNVWWEPTQEVKDLFDNVIGEKYYRIYRNKRLPADMANTNICIDGIYLTARGGHCPSGLRLAEIVEFQGYGVGKDVCSFLSTQLANANLA